MEKCVFSTPLVEVGQNRGFPRQRHKKCKAFCYSALFPRKVPRFHQRALGTKIVSSICNFDWRNSASGQAKPSENESGSSDKSWLESFFAKLGTGQISFVPSGFWARFWFKIAPQLMKNPQVEKARSHVSLGILQSTEFDTKNVPKARARSQNHLAHPEAP